ncbi:hypothetical protein SAMD00019534_005700 [Acytostelium subglobosum LB1]|uniref:hypothetical protein n=1 Tax=Acytostelium subglobosum LB1 TaxID=1410327 RepID=UPI000644B4E4|nr:hypothetical protein SAMD00019534_005700 [Acytostelium subglobosum LB1]GAM17395.1 hypothetical protein SAMD00019534_005700 [Acytostelium subglobosum LB1]|eukprot:XP_012759457.1 hypothetical protein SAMD00019534_005700 [Acytostelium subglobosum LB1]
MNNLNSITNNITQLFAKGDYTDNEELKTDLKNLHKQVRENNVKKVKKLLSTKRAKHILNAASEDLDETAILIAAKANNFEMFELLLTFFKTCRVDINNPDKNGYTCLHHLFALPDVDPKLLLILLDADVHVNSINRDLNTPFHYFCQKFRSNSMAKEVFDRFIAKGANINATNKNGESPLHKAVFNNNLAETMVTLLLEAQANVNATNKNGESCLHYCVRMGRTDLVTLLIKYGADRTITKDNQTLYDIAIQENFTKLADLLKDGATIDTSQNGSTTELITLLQNPTLREDFRAFLRDELICEENISFWLDVESFRLMKIDSAQRVFKEFYRIQEKYIMDNSPSEINIPFTIKKEINAFIKTLPPRTEMLFDSSGSSSSPMLSPISMSAPNLGGVISSSSGSGNSSPSLSPAHSFSQLPTQLSSKTTPTDSGSATPAANPATTSTSTSTSNPTSTSSSSTNTNTATAIPSITTTSTTTSSQSTTTAMAAPASAPGSPQANPTGFDYQKIRTIYNSAQQHIFMLMATDSLAKYKKRTRKSKSYNTPLSASTTLA